MHILTFFYHESGLRSVCMAGPDAWLIIFCRTCRMISFGAVSLILALFLATLGVSDVRIGLFMTLTIIGDVIMSLLLTLAADRIMGRRSTLFIGSVLMVASGAVFATSNNYWLLLFAAVVGVVSATGGDFVPFRAVEESMLSELTSTSTRADVLVWYVTTASLGSALGFELSGLLVEFLRTRPGWTLLEAYHACFWAYSIMGGINLICNFLLSSRCELTRRTDDAVIVAPDTTSDTQSDAPLLQDNASNEPSDPTETSSLLPPTPRLPTPSRTARTLILTLWALLMIDSLADGMVSMTLTTYYMDQKFGDSLPKSTLGSIVSTSYVVSSFATLLGAPMSRRIGLVNTMVFTHIPSSAAVLAFPFPKTIPLTFILLLTRIGLNNMDQGPRAALIAAIVKPEQRTAIMGVTSVLRNVASTIGPSITGILSAGDKFWVAFATAGVLRLVYDFGLWALFIGVDAGERSGREKKETAGEDEEVAEGRAEESGEGH
ncbi:hypothetical protein HDV00_005653 [Rhizophlyctis rosea]|nr:hypothetical protein HDV00_005653 [Rhizophlyctis rosea]